MITYTSFEPANCANLAMEVIRSSDFPNVNRAACSVISGLLSRFPWRSRSYGAQSGSNRQKLNKSSLQRSLDGRIRWLCSANLPIIPKGGK